MENLNSVNYVLAAIGSVGFLMAIAKIILFYKRGYRRDVGILIQNLVAPLFGAPFAGAFIFAASESSGSGMLAYQLIALGLMVVLTSVIIWTLLYKPKVQVANTKEMAGRQVDSQEETSAVTVSRELATMARSNDAHLRSVS